MLSDQALTHYYANQINYFNFDDFCTSMQLFIERSEWQRLNLARWQTINLSNIVVVSVNQSLSLSECLRKLCIEMNIIQRDLNSAYHDSNRLRKNIIKTCRRHSTLIYELINASSDTSTLINVLQTSIINYEVVQKALSQQHQYSQDQDDQYFTDKQYRRKSSFDRRSEYANDRWSDEYSNRRDEYRDEFRDKSNDRFQIQNRRSKKCFVYEKSDC